MVAGSTGNCYLCGAELGKTAMKNHILKEHGKSPEDGQECWLLKIEGQDKNYWLFIDVPVDKTLSSIDGFLRKIWLECCGHLSAFSDRNGEIGKSRRLEGFNVGDKLLHEYDFGTPTDTLVTFVGKTNRKPQRNAVRLLARNVPPEFTCGQCGKPAEYVCSECQWSVDNPFFCTDCAEDHEHDYALLAVTNSPRMGECGYDGELDVYAFDPARFEDGGGK